MPFSAPFGKKIIYRWLAEKRPDLKCMVDFGAGAGFYGKLFHRFLPRCRCEAVEVFEPYIAKYSLSRIYQRIYNEDASKMALPCADIAVFGDVIEHMTKDVALDFIARIDAQYRHIIISIPFGSYPQGVSHGNQFERHLSEWSYTELCKIFSHFQIQYQENNIAVFIKQL